MGCGVGDCQMALCQNTLNHNPRVSKGFRDLRTVKTLCKYNKENKRRR